MADRERVTEAAKRVYVLLTAEGFPDWLSSVGAGESEVVVYTAKRRVPRKVISALAAMLAEEAEHGIRIRIIPVRPFSTN